jgi:F0F1-type ATP synthase assembly protein I
MRRLFSLLQEQLQRFFRLVCFRLLLFEKFINSGADLNLGTGLAYYLPFLVYILKILLTTSANVSKSTS